MTNALISDVYVDVEQASVTKTEVQTKPQIPMYVVIKAGSQTPERLVGPANDTEAMAAVQSLIRSTNGALKSVYVFKLLAAEEYVPSSRTLSIEDLADRLGGAAK